MDTAEPTTFWKTSLPLDNAEKRMMSQAHFVLDGVQYEDDLRYEDQTPDITSPRRAPLFAFESASPNPVVGNLFTANFQIVNANEGQQQPTVIFGSASAGDPSRNDVQSSSKTVRTTTTTYTTSGGTTEEVSEVDGPRRNVQMEPVVTVYEDGYGRAGPQVITSSRVETTRTVETPVVTSRATLHDNGGDKSTNEQGMFETIIRTTVDAREEPKQQSTREKTIVMSRATLHDDEDGNDRGTSGVFETIIRTKPEPKKASVQQSATMSTSGEWESLDEGSSGQGGYETVTRTETRTTRNGGVAEVGPATRSSTGVVVFSDKVSADESSGGRGVYEAIIKTGQNVPEVPDVRNVQRSGDAGLREQKVTVTIDKTFEDEGSGGREIIETKIRPSGGTGTEKVTGDEGSSGQGEFEFKIKIGDQGGLGKDRTREDEGSSGQGSYTTKIPAAKVEDKLTEDQGSSGQGSYITKIPAVKAEEKVTQDEGSSGQGSYATKIKSATKADDKLTQDEGSSGQGSYTTQIKSTTKVENKLTQDEGSSGQGSSTTKTKSATKVDDKLTQDEGSSGQGSYTTNTKSSSKDKLTQDEGSSGQGSYETKTRTEAPKPKQVQKSQTIDSTVHEEGFDEIKAVKVIGARVGEHEGTDFGVAIERKTAETEQLCSAEMEERKTFMIRSVVNPEDQKQISFQQAVMQGVVCPTSGTYVNTVTGAVIPLATAMSERLIDVVHTTVKRSPEKTSSIGIITVKTIREIARPYVIHTVTDTSRGDSVSQQEAVKRGLLDERHGVYLDRRTAKRMLIAEAAEKGLVKIEYVGEPPGAPEVISKIYAVRAVVDRRLKKTITFQDAIRAGIIDKESGAYKDNLTGEKMYVGDAIMRGFLKARLLTSSYGLNIDPENRMVIDKTDMIRKRLVRPLGVISAFKKAAQEGAARRAN